MPVVRHQSQKIAGDHRPAPAATWWCCDQMPPLCWRSQEVKVTDGKTGEPQRRDARLKSMAPLDTAHDGQRGSMDTSKHHPSRSAELTVRAPSATLHLDVARGIARSIE
jgi:hypothetical protein